MVVDTASSAVERNPGSPVWREPDGNGLRVFSEGDTLFESMLADLASARRRVWMESYIFADDTIGRDFVAALAACAERGCDVRLRIDALGSHFAFSAASARRLQAAGVRFGWWHPWNWRRPWTFHRRNHRKLLVVDAAAAYLGGFNVSELSSRKVCGAARWRDTHVRLTGPIVREAAAAFEAFGRGELDWCGDEERPLYLLTNHARHYRYRLRRLLRQRVAAARERVWLTTPYFVPDSVTQLHLVSAAARGVDVQVLVPAKNDVRIVQWASRAAYTALLGSGVRVFEYMPRTLHGKTLLVDDNWATVGTANFDYRSFSINYELNLVGWSRHLNAALAALFENDLSNAREIHARRWALRPLSGRIAETIGWGVRRWL